MTIIVHGKAPTKEYRWALRPGQRATVGRSIWADFCVEDDEHLRDLHCQIGLDWPAQAFITSIEQAPIQVATTWTTKGNRQELHVTAGQTCLVLSRAAEAPVSTTSNCPRPSVDTMVKEADLGTGPTLELLRAVGMSEAALVHVLPEQAVMSNLQAIRAQASQTQSHLADDDALRYLAACLPPRQRLQWCTRVLQQAGIKPLSSGWELVELWLAQPTETLRRAIAAQVDWNCKLDPRTWLLASIGWTGGSLSNNNSVHVAPTDQMVITGVITALSLSGTQTDRSQFYSHAIQTGQELLQSLSPSSLRASTQPTGQEMC